MRVGMTFDLKEDYLAQGFSSDEVAELDSPVTVDALERALRSQGHRVERIGGVCALTQSLARGERWDLVFNIAEGVRGQGREAQVPALLDAWGIPYTFSGPDLLALTLRKDWTNAVLRTHGIATADFVTVSRLCEVEDVSVVVPLFAKPVAEGSSKGVSARSLVRTSAELREVCAELLVTYRQPVLVETYLPGREFTVGLLGTGTGARVLGVMEVLVTPDGDQAAYTYENKQQWQSRVRYALASDDSALRAAELALEAWRCLGCRDAGRVDVRLDGEGLPRFLEVNPLAGLNPESSDLPILCRKIGLEYDMLIAQIMDSATGRMRTPGIGRRAA